MAVTKAKEVSLLSKMQKTLIALLSVIVLFFGFVIVRIGFKPISTVKAAVIPSGEYDPAVWGQHYPLQYEKAIKKCMKCHLRQPVMAVV